jgi:RNA polymerase sigma factor (sigma-70 family)
MEEINPTRPGHQEQPGTVTQTRTSNAAMVLSQFIEREAKDIIGILRSYVRKAGLASTNEEVQEAALDVLSEVYLEAVKSAHRFDATRSPRAWLLGIATNIIKHRKARQAKLAQEISLSSLQRDQQEEGDFAEHSFNLTNNLISEGLEQHIEAQEQLEYLFSFASASDRKILRLSIIEGLDGEALAQYLGCPYKTAQVRLCRAKKRLRIALEKQGGERNE